MRTPLMPVAADVRLDVRRLMHAVLHDGLRTLLEHPNARRRLEELRWLQSTERNHAFTFEALSEALDLDAERLRRRLVAMFEARWRERPPAPRRPHAAPRAHRPRAPSPRRKDRR